ncbi:MAG: tetratricopeptide repeat protein [Bryobacteraceae bacterium]
MMFQLIMLQLIVAPLVSAGVPSEIHQRGVDFYKQQKYPEAIAALQTAVQSEGPATDAYKESVVLIGQSYFMLSQSAKAIPWLEKLPYTNEANYMLGYAYLQTKEESKSEAAFARLFGVNPESAAGHLVAGQMLIKKEFYVEAAAELAKAVAMDPKLPETHFLLGELAILGGRMDEAIDDLKAELAVNPNFSMAWYRLGDAYTRQELWDRAIPNLQRAVWLNQNFSGPFILLGKCYFKQQDYMNAEGILRRALIIDPNNHSANYLLAQTLMAKGKKEEARALLQKVKDLKDPTGASEDR